MNLGICIFKGQFTLSILGNEKNVEKVPAPRELRSSNLLQYWSSRAFSQGTRVGTERFIILLRPPK